MMRGGSKLCQHYKGLLKAPVEKNNCSCIQSVGRRINYSEWKIFFSEWKIIAAVITIIQNYSKRLSAYRPNSQHSKAQNI